MLESTLKEQLKGIFAGLNANYTFDISISPAHESRQELLDLLGDVASCRIKYLCEYLMGMDWNSFY